MTLNQFQQLALRTSGTDHDRVKNGCLGLIGEGGEVVDTLKKYIFQSGDDPQFPTEKLIEEMGDILWYLAETATGTGRELSAIQEDYKECDKNIPDTKIEDYAVEIVAAATFAYGMKDEEAIDFVASSIACILAILTRICALVGTSIEYVAKVNVEKLKKRYPDGFDPERSRNRPE